MLIAMLNEPAVEYCFAGIETLPAGSVNTGANPARPWLCAGFGCRYGRRKREITSLVCSAIAAPAAAATALWISFLSRRLGDG